MIRLGTGELTPATVARLTGGPLREPVGLDGPTTERMRRSVALRERLVASGEPLYGVTTGFGDRNIGHIPAAHATELQHHLIRYHLVGSGPEAPAPVVRATLLIRANCLARGYSGVRPEVVDLLLDCLRHDLLPVIPERGSVGASGDLVPLCYLAALLIGEGTAVHHGRRRPAREALAAAGLRPLALQPKEALALINGTSFMAAFAVHAAAEARRLAGTAEACTALAVEVLLGNRDHYHPVIHRQKPHPGQVRSAARIRALLDGSQLARDHARVLSDNRPGDGQEGYRRLDHPIQDRYSVRCAPHVIGVLHDTLDWVDRWLDTEINSTNDNPLFDPDGDRVHNGGNFYGGHVGLAMDSLRVAVASVGDLLDRQLACVVDEKFSNGLTAGLTAPTAADDPAAGLHHGFKGAQIACSALVAEALSLGMPATAFSRSTEAHNQDKVSMATIGARSTRTVTALVHEAAAIQLAALCQAADLRGAHLLAPGTAEVYRQVRRHLAFMPADRRLDTELAALAEELRTSGAAAEATPAPAPAPAAQDGPPARITEDTHA
ncbi:aromatic amino acid ammonia-lyase [Kitasatospora sp. NPDC048540]|uniref:HAL/PAL/TAL family ammonia-lyase n=1 Tax=unclassified Kitasatospora TaxID=2633591 RepID=UPI0007C7AED8|nr:aromatic amino acid ammonia-lyase [Kitasatospora sp. MBT63]